MAEAQSDRRRTILRKTIVSAVAVIVLAGLPVIDRRMSEKDRTAYHASRRDLISVRDEVLRFQHDNGKLPSTLQELCPNYLREDQLSSEGRPLYSYDPDGRTIAMSEAFTIRGLVKRARPPVVMDLPGTPEQDDPPPADPPPVDPPPVVSNPPEPPDNPPTPTDPPPAPGAKPIAIDSPRGPKCADPPTGAYVLEAETYSKMNWGWEVAFDKTSAGGAYIHCKEGMSNEMAQINSGIYDYHGIQEKRELSILRYHFTVPKSGRYYIYGRMWTTGSHCSNCVFLSVDTDVISRYGHYSGEKMSNTTPFRWVWTMVGEGRSYLSEGDHYFEIFMHEDGLRLDQFLITPEPLPWNESKAFTSNLTVNDSGKWTKRNPRLLDLTFSTEDFVITADKPPAARLMVRRQCSATGKAELCISFEKTELLKGPLDLTKLPLLSSIAIPFDKIDVNKLARREYLLKAVITQDGKEIAETNVPFVHPMKWEVSKKLYYLGNSSGGPYDGDKDSDDAKWVPLKETCLDHFGVLDFGLHTVKNSLHAPPWSCIYARTKIHVPKAGEYMLKLQADDNLLLWIDGKLAHDHDKRGPVTRSAKRLRVRLKKGEHRIRIRVSQKGLSGYNDGRWQASLRFRTADDLLSDIVGR